MGNMTYVQFENTFRDLQQCYEAIHDELSEEEDKYRRWLIALCKDIADEFEDEE